MYVSLPLLCYMALALLSDAIVSLFANMMYASIDAFLPKDFSHNKCLDA